MAATTNTCPSCKMPEQLVLLPSGFCGAKVPAVTAADGTSNEGGKETLVAIKAFDVRMTDPAHPLLVSPVFDFSWPSDVEWYKAECLGHQGRASFGEGRHHSGAEDILNIPPVKGCSHGHGCGFYCPRTWDHALENAYHGNYTMENPRVLGKVTLAGKVIAAENGWRAGELRIDELYVPHELWQIGTALAKEYPNVKVDTKATLLHERNDKIQREWCARCGAKMPKRSNVCAWCGNTHL